MMNGTGNNANAEKIVTLEVTLNEANVILAGLGELPAKVTIGLINKLQSQAASQLQGDSEVVPASALGQQSVN